MKLARRGAIALAVAVSIISSMLVARPHLASATVGWYYKYYAEYDPNLNAPLSGVFRMYKPGSGQGGFAVHAVVPAGSGTWYAPWNTPCNKYWEWDDSDGTGGRLPGGWYTTSTWWLPGEWEPYTPALQLNSAYAYQSDYPGFEAFDCAGTGYVWRSDLLIHTRNDLSYDWPAGYWGYESLGCVKLSRHNMDDYWWWYHTLAQGNNYGPYAWSFYVYRS